MQIVMGFWLFATNMANGLVDAPLWMESRDVITLANNWSFFMMSWGRIWTHDLLVYEIYKSSQCSRSELDMLNN